VILQLTGTGSQPITDGLLAGTIAGDRHYTCAELGKAWHLSSNTVRRLMEKESGVVRVTSGLQPKPRKRHMTQLRIPERVALRVHARLSIN